MSWSDKKDTVTKNVNGVSAVTSIITASFLVTSVFLSLGMIWNIKVNNPGVTLFKNIYWYQTGAKENISISSL